MELTRENPVLDHLAVQHLDNQLYLSQINIWKKFKFFGHTDLAYSGTDGVCKFCLEVAQNLFPNLVKILIFFRAFSVAAGLKKE